MKGLKLNVRDKINTSLIISKLEKRELQVGLYNPVKLLFTTRWQHTLRADSNNASLDFKMKQNT